MLGIKPKNMPIFNYTPKLYTPTSNFYILLLYCPTFD